MPNLSLVLVMNLLYMASSFYLNLGTIFSLINPLIRYVDYSIQELNSTRSADFINEASNWETVGTINPTINYYLCGDRYVIGGYNIFKYSDDKKLVRTYTGLKTHNMIYYSYTLGEIDTPDDYYSYRNNHESSFSYKMSFDNTVIDNSIRAYYKNSNQQQYVCGEPNSPDKTGIRIFGRVAHSDSELRLLIRGQRNSDMSVGFRDVRLLFAETSDPKANTPTVCLTIPEIYSIDTYYSKPCGCLEGHYADSSGACRPCNHICSSCFGSSAKECYWCADGAEWVGTHCKSKPSFLTLVRLLQYTRYLNIYLPPRLRSFLDRPASNLFPINSESTMPQSHSRHFGIHSLPPMFAEYNLHSNFFVNFWGEIITMLTFVVIGLVLWGVQVAQSHKRKTPLRMFLRQITLLFKWNFVLMLFAFNIDYIILFASLQFQGVSSREPASIAGVICSVIALLLVVIFFRGVYYICKIITTSSRYEGTTLKNKKTYASFFVLYGGYKQQNRFTKFFYIIYMVRIGLPSLISATLYNFPAAQATLYMLINAAILVLIILKKPLIRKINQIQLTIHETTALIINICMLILAAHDSEEWRDSKSTITLGDLVIYANTFINLVTTVFLVLKLGIETRRIWRMRKIKSYLKSGAWISLVGVYIQQGGFGFEEVFQERIVFDDEKNTRRIFTSQAATGKNVEDIPAEAIVQSDIQQSQFRAIKSTERLRDINLSDVQSQNEGTLNQDKANLFNEATGIQMDNNEEAVKGNQFTSKSQRSYTKQLALTKISTGQYTSGLNPSTDQYPKSAVEPIKQSSPKNHKRHSLLQKITNIQLTREQSSSKQRNPSSGSAGVKNYDLLPQTTARNLHEGSSFDTKRQDGSLESEDIFTKNISFLKKKRFQDNQMDEDNNMPLSKVETNSSFGTNKAKEKDRLAGDNKEAENSCNQAEYDLKAEMKE